MLKTGFWVNTAMVCYNCRKTALVRIMQSWRNVFPVGQETEVLDIVYVSCVVCITLPHVHNPISSKKHYINPFTSDYSNPVSSLTDIFGCTPVVDSEIIFVIKAFRMMELARVRDVSEIFNMSTIPDENIMILENGREIRNNCRFFRHDSYFTIRHLPRYPSKDSKDEGDTRSMPFALIANRPPVQVTLIGALGRLPVSTGCLSSIFDEED